MGRRVSVDRPQTKAGGRGVEGHKDYPHEQPTNDKLSRDTQDPLHAAFGHKQWPPTSKHNRKAASAGSLFCPASASNSSHEADTQTISRHVRSTSRSSQINRVDSNAKALLSSTGRAFKRHATKLSLASSISFEKDEEGKTVWKLSGLGASVTNSEAVRAPSIPKDLRKRAISAPFGFKHVTHTYREQVRGLERASRNELISEFSAIRAGQRADPHLRGIKAESLPSKEAPSSPAQKEPEHQARTSSTNIVLPVSTSCTQLPRSTSSSTVSLPQCHRPVENFSRPVSRASLLPVSPPKRISSLNACGSVAGISEDALDTNDHVRGSRNFVRRASRPTNIPAALLLGSHTPDQEGNVVAIGHAISTPDDSARHLKASPLPMLPVDLDDVPEDEEGFVHCESRTSPSSCGNGSLPLRHVQSFPSSRHGAVRNDQLVSCSSNTLRHTNSLDEGQGGSILEDSPADWSTPEPHAARRNTKRFSIGLKPMSETEDWEQDVDYSYEHAAEAESEFDWDHQIANFPVGLQPSTLGTCDISKSAARDLQQLAGLRLHGRKHDSQESSVLSVASSIIDISRSTNSVGSLPELDYSINSSQESMEWGTYQGRKRKSKSTRPSQPTSPAKSPRGRQGLGLPYSLFPSNTTTPPRTP